MNTHKRCKAGDRTRCSHGPSSTQPCPSSLEANGGTACVERDGPQLDDLSTVHPGLDQNHEQWHDAFRASQHLDAAWRTATRASANDSLTQSGASDCTGPDADVSNLDLREALRKSREEVDDRPLGTATDAVAYRERGPIVRLHELVVGANDYEG